jgi:hypothetical protein
MARIPMGNFGNALPDVQETRLPASNINMLADAVGNFGQVVTQQARINDEKQRQEEVTNKNIELYNNKIAEKEGQLKLDESLSTDFNDKVVDIKNRLGNGVINAKQADEELNTFSTQKFAELQPNLPGHAQDELKKYWDSNVVRQRSSFMPLQLRADEQKGGVLADRFFNVATRMGREEGKKYLSDNLIGLPLSEAQKSELAIKYETARDVNDVNSKITEAIAANDIDALKNTATSLKDYKFIDGGTVQKFQTEIQSKVTTLQQRQQVNENKRINEAEKVVNDYIQSTLTGRPLDLTYQSNVEEAVKGTPSEAEFQFYKKQSADFIRFQALPTDQQLAEINSRKAKMKNSSSADPVAENKIMTTYQSIYDNKLKTAKENPTQALREKGIQLPEITPQTVKSNPDDFAKRIITIGSYQVAQRDKDPNATIKPIPNEALPAAKQAWEEATVDQKLNLISSMITQTKGIKNGAKIWGEALGQLGNGDAAYQMAGYARANNFRSDAGLDVATAIVAGKQALKNKQMIQPKDALLKEKFNQYVGQSVSGETANLNYAAFQSIYAYLTEARGQTHKDADEYKDEIGRTALGLATGGVYTQKGGFKDYTDRGISDWKVSKPYGMTDSTFESKVQKGYSDISKATGMSVNDLDNFRLSRSTTKASNGDLMYDLINERGRPLVVKGAVWRIRMSGVTK